MAIKDVRQYFYTMLDQYLEEKHNLADFEIALKDGLITEEQMQEAYDYCLDCFMEKRIPLKDVSDKALNKLGLKRNINIFKRGINNSTFKL
jgi:hypothetical protein